MRGKPLAIDDIVLFRFFNAPDGHFYGDYHRGKVIDIRKTNDGKDYLIDTSFINWNIRNPDCLAYPIWIHRKEIIKWLDPNSEPYKKYVRE
jgi:hypothetical protein